MGKQYMAHRVSFWIATGENLDGDYFVCHKCDNPGCVNPVHLWKGDGSANMQDAYSKGRVVSQTNPEKLCRGDAHPFKRPEMRAAIAKRQQGARSHRAKLTEQQAAEIHRMRATGLTHQEIADTITGISREQVGNIIRGDQWSDAATPDAISSHAAVNGRRKLTPDDVRLVRALRQGGQKLRVIAAEVGVTESVISTILSGKAWAHVV